MVTRGRLAYIDGLRGVAVGMVVLHHMWYHYVPHRPVSFLPTNLGALDFLMSQMSQGVSLFLVLSGFCLSYPALRRRQAGVERWFIPSEFFARRVLRIVPAYYAGLVIFSVVAVLLAHFHQSVESIGAVPQTGNVLSHMLFIHNMTGNESSINASYWSLGLEWQWYWIFPLLLLVSAEASAIVFIGCLGIGIAWLIDTHGMMIASSALPGRLFEFCCGIAVAQILLAPRRIPGWAAAVGALTILLAVDTQPLAMLAPVQLLAGRWFLVQPLHGVAFGLLIILGAQSKRVNFVLSWRPLVLLGVASYSVYLVQQPVIEMVQRLVPVPGEFELFRSLLAGVAAPACGTCFYFLIERPCTHESVKTHFLPFLERSLAWTNRLYPDCRRKPANHLGILGAEAPAK